MSRARVAAVLLLSACASERPSAAATVETWTVDSAATLTIGLDAASDVGVSFERITGATRLPDGTLLVADLGEAPLRLFGTDGELLRRVARRGGGPGEMEYIARLFRCGDAIYTYDLDGHRVSQYGLDATYRRMFRFAVPTGQQAPYGVSSCNASGRFVHLGWGSPPRVAGYHRDTVAVWVTETADGPPSIVDSVPSSERWGQTYQGRLVGSSPLPLGKQPATAFGPTGFYVSTGDSLAVLVYDTSGARIGEHRFAGSIAAVTPEDVRDFIEAEVAENGEQARAGIEREYAAITFPERHGAVTGLLVDADGLLWVRTYAPPTSASVAWRVLSAAGTETATVSLPRRLEVFEIGGDYVLGREIDANEGVPVLRLLTLRRSPAR
jgi:hypothetical protein